MSATAERLPYNIQRWPPAVKTSHLSLRITYMDSSLVLGAYFKLLPVTSTFALPLSLYYIFLQVRVSLHRIASQKSLEQSSIPSSSKNDDPLHAAFRA